MRLSVGMDFREERAFPYGPISDIATEIFLLPSLILTSYPHVHVTCAMFTIR